MASESKRTDESDTAAAILAAAALLMPDYGYGRVTIRDVARRAGIGLGTVYGHFRGKDEIGARLVARSVEDVHAAMRDLLASSAPPPDRLRDLLVARVAMRREQAAGQRHPVNEATPELAAALAPWHALWHERERLFLLQALEAGGRNIESQGGGESRGGSAQARAVRPQVLEELAQTLLWATDGLVAEALSSPGHSSPGGSVTSSTRGTAAHGATGPSEFPSSGPSEFPLYNEPAPDTPLSSPGVPSPQPDPLLLKTRRVADLLVAGVERLWSAASSSAASSSAASSSAASSSAASSSAASSSAASSSAASSSDPD